MESALINYIKNMFAMESTPVWSTSYEGTIFYDKTARKWITGTDVGWQVLDRKQTVVSGIEPIDWIDPFEYYNDEVIRNNYTVTTSSGTGGFVTAKSVIFDIADNWGGNNYITIRQIDFYLNGTKLVFDNTDYTSYATTYIGGYPPSPTFDQATSLIGGQSANQWVTSVITNQRLICVFNVKKDFNEIRVNNGHYSGGYTTEGAKNVKINTSTDSIISTIYDEDISNATLLFDGYFDEHDASDIEDEKIISLQNVEKQYPLSIYSEDVNTSYGEYCLKAVVNISGSLDNYIRKVFTTDINLTDNNYINFDIRSNREGKTLKFSIEGNKFGTWGNVAKLTVPAEKIDENLTHFPVSIVINDTNGLGAVFDEFAISNINDSFTGSDEKPNNILWSYSSDNVYLNNNKLRMDGASTTTLASRTYFFGNFDVQMDLDIISAPSTNSWSLTLRILDSDTDDKILISKRYNYSHYYSMESYISSSWANINSVSSIDTICKLRVVRSGNIFYCYYWGVNDWISVGSYSSSFNNKVRFDVAHSSWNSPSEFIGDFDNFTVNYADKIVWANDDDPNRKKIAVTKADGFSQLYCEIEDWDSYNRKATLWVSKDDLVLSSTEDTNLYLYYDKNQPDNDEYIGDTGDVPARQVWDSNHVAVYNLAQDPSSGDNCILDSTSNFNYGTPQGIMTSDDLVNGQIGKALEFDGVDDYITVNSIANHLSTSDDVVLTVAFNTNSTPSSNWSSILIAAHQGSTNKLLISPATSSTNGIRVHDGVSTNIFIGSEYMADGDDHILSLRFNNPGAVYGYIDGVYVGSGTQTVLWGDADNFSIGQEYDTGGASDFFPGVIGTVSISNSDRSEAWIKATHRALNDSLLEYEGPSSDFYNNELVSKDININIANTFQTEVVDITSVSGIGKTVRFTVIDNSLANEFYIDNMRLDLNKDINWIDSLEYVDSTTLSGIYTNTSGTALSVIENFSDSGKYAMQITAASGSLNSTVEKILDTPLDIVGNYISMDIASSRNGTNIKAGFCFEPANNFENLFEDYSELNKIEIVIDKYKVPTTQENFPVYIDLATLSNTDFFDTVSDDGGNIICTLDVEATQFLPREVVYVDKVNKNGELHVKLPYVYSDIETKFYIWYNGDNEEPAFDSIYGRNNVWSDYVVVYHMAIIDTTDIIDSTGNDNNGTIGGNMDITNLVKGKVGKALNFDGVADFVDCNFNTNYNNFTISTILKKQINQESGSRQIISKNSYYAINTYDFPTTLYIDGPTTNIIAGFDSGGDYSWDIQLYGGNTEIEKYYHIHTTCNSTITNLYVDGDLADSGNGVTPVDNTRNWIIGGASFPYGGGVSINKFAGSIDEVRLSENQLTSDWVNTEYNNQNSPTTFYSVNSITKETYLIEDRVLITIDKSNVPEILENFPVYIDLSHLQGTNFFNKVKVGGGDIRCTLYPNGNQLLPREVVWLDIENQQGELHVKVPIIYAYKDTTFYIWVDGVNSEPAFDSSYGRNAVWSDYAAVYHMNEVSPNIIDSTGNENNGTPQGGMSIGNVVEGKVGRALEFDGVDDCVNLGSNAFTNIEDSDFTIDFYLKNSEAVRLDTILAKKGSIAEGLTISLRDDIGSGVSNEDYIISGFIKDSSENYIRTEGTTIINDGNWHKISMIYTDSTKTLVVYVDGVEDSYATNTSVSSWSLPTENMFISCDFYNTGRNLEGAISELLISPSVSPSYLIETKYNNQNSPETFYTVSTLQVEKQISISEANTFQKETVSLANIHPDSKLSKIEFEVINDDVDTEYIIDNIIFE